MDAFAGFLNDQSLTEHQIDFVNRVVDHIVANDYMEPTALGSPPHSRAG